MYDKLLKYIKDEAPLGVIDEEMLRLSRKYKMNINSLILDIEEKYGRGIMSACLIALED